MRVGDVMPFDGVEWTVVRLYADGAPAMLRTCGRVDQPRPQTTIRKFNATVMSRRYDKDAGYTELHLFPPKPKK